MNGLDVICDGLADHEQRKAAGTLGALIEVDCPTCGWHAHSYTCYLDSCLYTVDEARVWLLAQHACKETA